VVTVDAPRAMRVLHVISGQYYAGAERVQDLLAQHLPAAHCDVGFACVSADQFPSKRQCQQVPLARTAMRYPWISKAVEQIVRMIKDDAYDLVHSHTPRSAWAAVRAAKIAGCPFVHTMHDVSLGQPQNLTRRVFGAYTISRLRVADVVTTVSPTTAALAQQLELGKTRRMILNGVPSARPQFQRTPPGDTDGHGTWNLGTVGLIRPCKGVEVLVRAVKRLRDRGCHAEATVVGTFYTPQYERQVMDLVSSLDLNAHIHFVGFSDNVPAHLETFDLFVMPSIGPEGLPMVLLESMAHGLPTLGSDVAGVGDVVRPEIDGLLFPPGDHNALAAAAERFLRGDVDWKSMSEAARQRHHEEFSVQRMAAEFADVYRGLP
jgi:glycosyltransferase involved in cell wall biosynthesis